MVSYRVKLPTCYLIDSLGRWPIRRYLAVEPGSGTGVCHCNGWAWALESWEELINRARRPVGESNRMAIGRMESKRSTARRVTMSAVEGKSSARPANTSMFVNVVARAASRRNATFLWFDSMSVRWMWGAQIFRGRPGKPAPDPRSTTDGAGEATWDAGSLVRDHYLSFVNFTVRSRI